ncbi:ABC transporter permease [Bosea sp. (in: a-proteobacteria)]|uniref:ABC transporter permease n=1 Tax=Bosea sp. (in: a-proteobacteria) TaxID=1871050 RepID=UPI002625E2BF|nr:ABC transporter permease [Bosea sp. (in: a-proteobacteria)]MCO5091233.1 ABC transporter permease [Bosea sp. (in: a-proteobacteria)]
MSKSFSKAWLLSDAPASSRQAAWGQRYQAWLAFRRNRLAMAGLIVVVLLLLMALLAPWLATHDPDQQNLGLRLARPSAAHWLGTDELGRDLWSRLVFGARITLGMVVAVMLLVAPIGLLIGCTAGYAGGGLDRLLMRVTDIFLAFPRLILALAFVAALKPGVESAVIAIALTGWPAYARLARAETLAVRNADFICAVRLAGASATRTVLRHVTPIAVPSVIVRVTLDMSSFILVAAGLGFLGLGAQPPLPEWGTMIATSRRFILEQWWVPLIPGIAVFLASLAFNLLGDGLRDVLDPKQR